MVKENEKNEKNEREKAAQLVADTVYGIFSGACYGICGGYYARND